MTITDHTSTHAPRPAPTAAGETGISEERLPIWISLLALFSIVFIRAPLIINHPTLVGLLTISLFAAGTAWLMPMRLPERISPGAAKLLALYLALSGIAMIRGSSAGVYPGGRATFLVWATVASMGPFIVALCATARTNAGVDARLKLIVYAPAVYVAVNVLLRIFREHLPFALPDTTSVGAGGTDEIAKLFGIHATRVNFPIALGVYNLGAIAAAGFGGAVLVAIRSRRRSRRVAILAAAVCLYGVIATDTRGPLIIALGAIALFVVARRIRTSGVIAVFLVLSSIITLQVLGLFAGTGFGNGLSRHNGDIATANNRLFIWQTVFNFLKHPRFEQLIGYGANGQVTSHVSDGYAYRFGHQAGQIFYTTHNIGLQTIMDSGYIGLGVLVAGVVVCIRCLERRSRSAAPSIATPVLALLLILVVSGALEAAPSYLFLDTFVLFVVALAAAAGSLPRSTETALPHQAATVNYARTFRS